MWRAFDETGRLAYPDFIETTLRLIPMYWVRVVGGSLYLAGTVLCGVNLLDDLEARPGALRRARLRGGLTARRARPPDRRAQAGRAAIAIGFAGRVAPPLGGAAADLHGVGGDRRASLASLFEIIPMFLIRSNVPTIATVKPYTPLELAGRDVYIAEGCNNCHSQMIRPIRAETVRYGEYSKPGEFVYDHPFLWGSRRIGPDLQRVGGKYPTSGTCATSRIRARSRRSRSCRPTPWLARDADRLRARSRGTSKRRRCSACRTRGRRHRERRRSRARPRRRDRGGDRRAGRPEDLEDKQVVALIAYLQRLGRDIKRPPATAAAAAGSEGR